MPTFPIRIQTQECSFGKEHPPPPQPPPGPKIYHSIWKSTGGETLFPFPGLVSNTVIFVTTYEGYDLSEENWPKF